MMANVAKARLEHDRDMIDVLYHSSILDIPIYRAHWKSNGLPRSLFFAIVKDQSVCDTTLKGIHQGILDAMVAIE